MAARRLVLITQTHGQLSIELGQDTRINGRHLLTDYRQADAKLASLARDVAEHRTELESRRVEDAGGLLDDKIDMRQVVEAPQCATHQVG